MDDAFSSFPPSYRARGSLSHESTFRLMERWVTDMRKYQRLSQGWWLLPFVGKLRERQKAQARDSLAVLQRELIRRYRGILLQIWRRAGVKDAALGEVLALFLTSLWDRSLPLRDHRKVPGALWRAVEQTCNPDPALKGKLMLRPFLDELPDCDERGALRAFYGMTLRPPAAQDILELLDSAYEKLHDQLRQYRGEICLLTDGVLTQEAVSLTRPSTSFYDDILFAGA